MLGLTLLNFFVFQGLLKTFKTTTFFAVNNLLKEKRSGKRIVMKVSISESVIFEFGYYLS